MTVTFSNPSPQLSAVLRFYDAITNWKFEVIDELFSDDYIHTTLPSSANEAPKDKAQGLAHAKGVAAALGYTPLKYDIIQLSESESKETIWVHSKLQGEGPGGATFANESIFIFTLRSSGDKIKIAAVQDFVDTKQAADAAAAAAAAAAAQQ